MSSTLICLAWGRLGSGTSSGITFSLPGLFCTGPFPLGQYKTVAASNSPLAVWLLRWSDGQMDGERPFTSPAGGGGGGGGGCQCPDPPMTEFLFVGLGGNSRIGALGGRACPSLLLMPIQATVPVSRCHLV